MKVLTVPSSGSQAGTTASHNRAGQYTRNRRTPVVGTRTPRQAIVKANMTTASQGWAGLTALQQAAWESYATGHPITDALGQSIKLTGAQYYIKVNAALLNVLQPVQTSPPINGVVVPEMVVNFQANPSNTFLIQRTPGAITDFVAIACSKATSNGVNFQKTFTQIGVVPADQGLVSLGTQALAVMGTFIVGTKAWARLTPVNSSGLTGSPLIVQIPVSAAPTIATPVDSSTVATKGTVTWTGAPASATVWYETGPTATGPFGLATAGPDGVSPQTINGLTTGQFFRARLQDDSDGQFGPFGNAVVVM